MDDYMEIHNWFDCTKQLTGDFTHRAIRHHAHGIEECIKTFGHYVTNSEFKNVPTKMIAEQHVLEDCGFIPTVQDWLKPLKKDPLPWMLRVSKKSRDLELDEINAESKN